MPSATPQRIPYTGGECGHEHRLARRLAQSLQVVTRELLALKARTPVAAPPRPDPSRESQGLLPNLTGRPPRGLGYQRMAAHPWSAAHRRGAHSLLCPRSRGRRGLQSSTERDPGMVWAEPPPDGGGVSPVELQARSQATGTDGYPPAPHQEVAPARPVHHHRGCREVGRGPVLEDSATHQMSGRGNARPWDTQGTTDRPGTHPAHPGVWRGWTAPPTQPRLWDTRGRAQADRGLTRKRECDRPTWPEARRMPGQKVRCTHPLTCFRLYSNR
ncbi:VPS37B subunit of ESCRT-I b isoform X1 [Ictalurus furcatus]|uniref:VPS37B subunit of ESCRT-I b isoform X1 n=1 Tax=Ictalurus furcatus TaxID=66913 RepID=UPI00234FFF7E|nr:VPS37B subunit of ESCRT-I b isoform X1 [Ictalurus furcatus]